MTFNVAYRIRRLFEGESGVVERTESTNGYNITTKEKYNYISDDFFNLPRQVFFRNPLGELCESLTPMELIEINDPLGFKDTVAKRYKQYKPGDKFP